MPDRVPTHRSAHRSVLIRLSAVLTGFGVVLAASGAAAHADEPTPDVAVAEPVVVEPAVTEPPVTEPPVTEAPVSEPETGAVDGATVAVGLPPVPTSTIPDAVIVAVGQPPVPTFTVPDASPTRRRQPVVATETPDAAVVVVALVAGFAASAGSALAAFGQQV